MKKVIIVDYGLGNIFSIRQALKKCGVDSLVTHEPEQIKKADGVLLPGVGAFGNAMTRLNELGLIEVLREQAAQGQPLLGICLGLQLLFSRSEEFGEHQGLNLIPGIVRRFPVRSGAQNLRVPFIGWNQLKSIGSDPFLKDLNERAKLFLVHSFFVEPLETKCVLATTRYFDFEYPVLVRDRNIFGVQGHPEKSGADGLALYSNWLGSL